MRINSCFIQSLAFVICNGLYEDGCQLSRSIPPHPIIHYSVIINGSDYIGLLGSVLYYILGLKNYHNFNGQKNRQQKAFAQFLIFFKLLLSFIIAFEWVFGRLDRRAILEYPMYLVISDAFHLIAWVCRLSYHKSSMFNELKLGIRVM